MMHLRTYMSLYDLSLTLAGCWDQYDPRWYEKANILEGLNIIEMDDHASPFETKRQYLCVIVNKVYLIRNPSNIDFLDLGSNFYSFHFKILGSFPWTSWLWQSHTSRRFISFFTDRSMVVPYRTNANYGRLKGVNFSNYPDYVGLRWSFVWHFIVLISPFISSYRR